MIVIEAKNLSKKYKLFSHYFQQTLRERIVDAIIKTHNKTKVRFNELEGGHIFFWALKGVSFQVKKGEILGILGENGAGKSTLLKILAGITLPDVGSVKIIGKVASLLEIGIGFHPELTGRENIYLSGSILGMNKKETTKKMNDIIDFSGIKKFIDVPVKKYSSGMYVRLAFSVAAHLDFDILLIDEILSVGDFDFQNKSYKKLKELINDKNKTVIFVSHNLEYLKKICNRCILLKEGEIMTIGDTSEVIEKYLENYKNKKNIIKKNKKIFNRFIEFFDIKNINNSSIICSYDRIQFIIVLNNNFRFYKKCKINIGIYSKNRDILLKIHTDYLNIEKIKSNKIKIVTDKINISPQVCYVDLALFLDGNKVYHANNIRELIIRNNSNIYSADIDLKSVNFLIRYKVVY